MEEIGDSRLQGLIDYPLPYILLVSFLAVLSGAETWVDMQTFTTAYKTKLNGILPEYKIIGVPSDDTFRRVFGIIKPEELQASTAQRELQSYTEAGITQPGSPPY